MKGANFSDADLRGAVFITSNLTKANLHGVDFTEGFAYLSNFDEANLTDAVFSEAIFIKIYF